MYKHREILKSSPEKKDCFCDTHHPEKMHSGVDLHNGLYDYQQAYQLYVYALVAAAETSVREHTERFCWTLPLVHTRQVPQP